jgi:periplasmic protein CpxP/Spy
MPSLTHQVTQPSRLGRSFAIAALLGATMLTTPLAVARADTASNAAFQLAQASAPAASMPKSKAGAAATDAQGESVEQRITTLHSELKITPDQDAKWNDVAQAMRQNAAAMDKLVADSRTTPPQNMSAVDDLKMYQKFAQAHVDGLKNLTSSFSTLYSSMSDAQKKTADQVFQAARDARQSSTAHS